MKFTRYLLGAAAIAAAGEYAIARYFFRRTMIRSNAKNERTMKMSGTDWNVYIPTIRTRREWMEQQPQEEVFITSRDGLKLHGTFYPRQNTKKVAICFHGYTSDGASDYASLGKFYLEHDFQVLLVDERAHGKSEGTYIGFGCLDRYDAKAWIDYVISRAGSDCQILLQGISMGAAIVLMTTGLALPPQVKAAVSDCAFTSAYYVFKSVLKTMYHLPAFPLMNLADIMNRRRAGYGLNECNAVNEVAKSATPTLFIHGDRDTFVPCSMVYELYDACTAPKELLVIHDASHAESYYKYTAAYENAVNKFINQYFQGGEI